MTSNLQFEVPNELVLINFWGAAPLKAVPEEGLWFYEIVDQLGLKLRLSFHLYERSLQIVILLREQEIITVVQEGAVQLSIVDDTTLECKFEYRDAFALLKLQIRPVILIHWSTLLT